MGQLGIGFGEKLPGNRQNRLQGSQNSGSAGNIVHRIGCFRIDRKKRIWPANKITGMVFSPIFQ